MNIIFNHLTNDTGYHDTSDRKSALIMEDKVSDQEEQLRMHSFQLEDFDAYLPNKWNSNMFTLERRRVKEKMERLGGVLAKELESLGLKLVMHASDEFPSFWNKKQVDRQWLFFSRDEAARAELTGIIDKERTLADTLADPTPMFRQIFLGVSVSEESLELGIWMHHDAWVDRRNFVSLCNDDEACKRLADLLHTLPDYFEFGIDTGEMAGPSAFNSDELKKFASAFNEEKCWLFLGARLPKDQVTVLGTDISSSAEDIFRTLAPVYQAIAWSSANDLISIDLIVAERNEALKQSREEFDRERAEREARVKEHKSAGAAIKEEIADRIRETAAWRMREIAAKRAHAMKVAAQAKEEDARARAEAMAAQWNLSSKKTEPHTETSVLSKPSVDERQPEPPKIQAPGRDGTRDKFTDRERTARSDKPRFQMPSREKEKRISKERYQVDLPRTAPPSIGDLKFGDSIEVIRGFLKGRRGTIQEIDEKGWIKVGFGMVSSRLAPEDLRTLGSEKGRSLEHHS
jgi:hypothetical protein